MFKNRFCWLLLLLLPVAAVFGDTPAQLEQAVAQYKLTYFQISFKMDVK